MGHVDKDKYAHLHQDGKKQAEKGCLWRHVSRYTPSNHCSHRAHARVKAARGSESGMYDHPAYDALCEQPTSPRPLPPAPIDKMYLAVISFGRKRLSQLPKPGDWDITDKPDNFAKSASRPYPHNAHHIIPNSTLTEKINKVGKTEPVIDFMKQGLLRGEYNLNGEPNMIILPMVRSIAAALQLPRHLKKHEALPHERDANDGKRQRDHPDYRRRVGVLLTPVLGPHATLARQAAKKKEEGHETPNFKLSGAQLDELSETIYAQIKAGGPFLYGKSLDAFKFAGVGGR